MTPDNHTEPPRAFLDFNPRESAIAIGLLVLWALLWLPNLRTSPNWYGDEGEWMQMCWSTAHGTPQAGPMKNDFLYPTPYPPLFMVITGTMLRAFGYDVVVGRTVGVMVGLAAAMILFWIGSRLRDRQFGFLCAAAFLVYQEANINFRWVRGHPMSGTLALAAIGFLVRYVQEKRARDIVWAGGLCSLATATNYYTYPLIGVIVVTALFVNWRHAPVALGAAVAYALLYLSWFVVAQPGGFSHLLEQAGRASAMASSAANEPVLDQATRYFHNVFTLGFQTPTHMGPQGLAGRDWWLVLAMVGMLFFPVARFRKWLCFWLLALMYAVLKKLDNVPFFFYPATVFLPLMAVGVAGALARLGDELSRFVDPKQQARVRLVPGGVALAVFGLISLTGALGHFRTKIDLWTQQSVADGEAVGDFVNSHTTAEDFVVLPKQIYWLVKQARVAMLWQTVPYNGGTTEAYPVPIPKAAFWFDCRWQNAKYIVLAMGRDAAGRPIGIDAVYTAGLRGMREIFQAIQAEKWPLVFQQGEFMVLANPRFVKEAK